MKRQLDDIELEEITGFHIFHNSLVVKTKEESYTYEYESSVELLKRISYFLRRYDVEYYRNEDNKETLVSKGQGKINPEMQKYKMKYAIIHFGVGCAIPFLLLLGFLGFIIFGVGEFVLLVVSKKEYERIISKISQTTKVGKTTATVLNTGYESLKEFALSYLNQLSTKIQNTEIVEYQYIEELEQAFQKRIGTYPIKKFDK